MVNGGKATCGGMVQGYEGPNDTVMEKCGANDHVSKGSQMPHTKDTKMEENMVGKDA